MHEEENNCLICICLRVLYKGVPNDYLYAGLKLGLFLLLRYLYEKDIVLKTTKNLNNLFVLLYF